MAGGGETVSEIKGSTFILRRKYVQERWGDAGLERALTRLDPEEAQVVRAALPIGWYPLALNARLDEAICQELAEGDPEVYPEMGAYSARSFAEEIYSSFFERVGPAAFLRTTSELFPLYYRNAGRKHDEFPGPGHAIIVFSGSPEVYRANCQANVGFFREGMRIVGGRNAECREESCILDGSDACRFAASWEE